jgi:hypothetical protein
VIQARAEQARAKETPQQNHAVPEPLFSARSLELLKGLRAKARDGRIGWKLVAWEAKAGVRPPVGWSVALRPF